jgi:hypothetical protein
MTAEQYIEHEVKIRMQDLKFGVLEESMKRMDAKINWLIGIVLTGIIIPVVLHSFELV